MRFVWTAFPGLRVSLRSASFTARSLSALPTKRLSNGRLASLSGGFRATPGRAAKSPSLKRLSRRWRGKESRSRSRDLPRMSAYCRFEILLPLEFNDGRPVPREFLAEAAVEVQRRFGGVSWESQVVEGMWRQGRS